MGDPEHYDVLVIGSGPGGQKAAICAAKSGRRVGLVERDRSAGGACVHQGTIPSKTLRENALQLSRLQRMRHLYEGELRDELRVAHLTTRLNGVVSGYSETVAAQLDRNGIDQIYGQARFASEREVSVVMPGGEGRLLSGDTIVIATGSRPRLPEGVPIDHEHILDSDSILAIDYLPRSLSVLGAGVIASEYASIFLNLGVKVTMVDSGPRPVGFLDHELSESFRASFEAAGGCFLPGRKAVEVAWDGVSLVRARFDDATVLESEKMLVAMGRTGCLAELGIANAGLEVNHRGDLEVDEHGRTAVLHIYAVGDVAGPPALATSAMEQGRRAVRHALGLTAGRCGEVMPMGIYTIPEMSSVGLTEEAAREAYGAVRIGRARLSEVARGQIAGIEEGFLKLIADPDGQRLLGVHILGEGATELIHVGQMALIAGLCMEDLVENVFNFPTLAEAYRIAAVEVLNQLESKPEHEATASP